MSTFHYTGTTPNGTATSGTIEANSKSEVVASLRKQGIFPQNITDESEMKRDIKIGGKKKKVTVKDLSLFCNQFGTILRAGISLIECLDILRKQTENKTLSGVVDELFEDVQKGVLLSKSMEQHKKVFPNIFVNMVASAEVSGQLDLIMERMASHFEKEFKLNSKIKGAMVYPVILISVSVLVTVFLLVMVLPSFVGMFSDFGVPLPLLTQTLLGVGGFFKKYWYIILGIIIIIVFSFKRFVSTKEGRLAFDGFKLKVPVFGKVNKKVATTRFARSLSTMINSGISIIESLELVSRVIGNEKIKVGIEEALEQVKKGNGVAGPLNNMDLFPPMMISMIKIGEDTGNMENMLETTANFYDEEVNVAIDSMIQMINPAILLIMAFIVGSIVLAIAMPMFEMYSHIQV